MQVTTYPDAAAFLDAARDELETAEAFNGLMLGIATRLERLAREGGADIHGEAEAPVYLTVDEGDTLSLAALRTPPRKAIVYGAPGWEAGLEMLIHHLARLDPALPGVLGPRPVAEAFADTWRRVSQCGVNPGMAMGVYELREVLDAGGATGQLRPAGDADLEVLTDWVCGFNEAVHEPMADGRDGVRREVENLIAAEQVYVWEDGGRAVSLARWGRPTAHGICVTTVYTPTERRRQGYATRCVAALSQLLLDQGNQFCTLFTDLANPTSNHIYQQIGYRRLGEFAEYHFAPRASAPRCSGGSSGSAP